MLRLRDFDDYEDAQLMRQKVAACFSVFITDPTGEAGNDQKPRIDRLEPGLIEDLAPGKQVTFANPPAADGYNDYSRNVLRAIAAGYGTTYEAMTGDLSNVNFSSGRMGWLEFQRLIGEWQQFMLLPMLCDRAWSAFIEGGVISGLLPMAARSVTAAWTFPAREMIDPVKEIKGKSEEVRNGFMSWQEAVREFGRDPETVLQQMKEDAENFTRLGLFPTSDPRFDVNRTNDPVDGEGLNTEVDDGEEKQTALAE
jgi:lambda family phage portal protein